MYGVSGSITVDIILRQARQPDQGDQVTGLAAVLLRMILAFFDSVRLTVASEIGILAGIRFQFSG